MLSSHITQAVAAERAEQFRAEARRDRMARAGATTRAAAGDQPADEVRATSRQPRATPGFVLAYTLVGALGGFVLSQVTEAAGVVAGLLAAVALGVVVWLATAFRGQRSSPPSRNLPAPR